MCPPPPSPSSKYIVTCSLAALLHWVSLLFHFYFSASTPDIFSVKVFTSGKRRESGAEMKLRECWAVIKTFQKGETSTVYSAVRYQPALAGGELKLLDFWAAGLRHINWLDFSSYISDLRLCNDKPLSHLVKLRDWNTSSVSHCSHVQTKCLRVCVRVCAGHSLIFSFPPSFTFPSPL